VQSEPASRQEAVYALWSLCGSVPVWDVDHGRRGARSEAYKRPDVPPVLTCGCDCLCEEVCPTGAIMCVFEIVMARMAQGRNVIARARPTARSVKGHE